MPWPTVRPAAARFSSSQTRGEPISIVAVCGACASGAAPSVVGIDLPDGDLTDAAVVASLMRRHAPDWVIHCAAWTDVDGAESRYDEALAANGAATGHLADACRRAGCGLTYISTDYVFDGRGRGGDVAAGYDEDDPKVPVNRYGLSKAAGEDHVRVLDTPWQIVRTGVSERRT